MYVVWTLSTLAVAGYGLASFPWQAMVVSFVFNALEGAGTIVWATTKGRLVPARLLGRVSSFDWFISIGLVPLSFAVTGPVAAVFGEDLRTNPTFGIFYVLLWVVVPLSSVLLGPVWKAISPVRSINWVFGRITGSDPATGVFSYPTRLGYWSAAVGLYAFVWIELVYSAPTDLASVRLWCAAYVATMLIGGALFGDRFYEQADPFDLVPTASTSVALAVGDALAVGLMVARGFGPEDFHRHHPDGALGTRLAGVDR
jgi:hypothetical protein